MKTLLCLTDWLGTVIVEGQTYTSRQSYRTKAEAQQEAAYQVL